MLEFIAGAALGGLAGSALGSTHSTNYVPVGPSRVDVHEHRAPTDDSVKLLREMEEKARDQIVGAFVTKSNELVGAVVYMQPNEMVREYNIYIRFKLNGKDYEFKQVTDNLEFSMSKYEAYKVLSERISNVITNELMTKITSEGT